MNHVQYLPALKNSLGVSNLIPFQLKSKEEKRKFDIEKLGYKSHDVWIASTAIQHNLTVVSEDGVFKRISEVRELRTECWI